MTFKGKQCLEQDEEKTQITNIIAGDADLHSNSAYIQTKCI